MAESKRSWGDIVDDEDNSPGGQDQTSDGDQYQYQDQSQDDAEELEKARGRFLAEVNEFRSKFHKIQGLSHMLNDPQVQDELYQLMGYEGCRLWTVRTGEPLPDCEEMAIPNNKYGDYLTLRRPYDVLADPKVVEALDAIKTPDEPDPIADARILRSIDKFSRDNGKKNPALSLMLQDLSVRHILRRLIRDGRYSLFMVTNSTLDARYLGIRVPYNADDTYLWLKKPSQPSRTVRHPPPTAPTVSLGFAALALDDDEAE